MSAWLPLSVSVRPTRYSPIRVIVKPSAGLATPGSATPPVAVLTPAVGAATEGATEESGAATGATGAEDCISAEAIKNPQFSQYFPTSCPTAPQLGQVTVTASSPL